ncbi:MAG: HigA family addiction module antitoxin [Candidatus Vecturithrix sp.]|jgi:HTH-type transcriptional regulator/antitoxin HigA|nr:HigA family addiction module antitoxin [Candidatus Vecturithrix sp.]
MMTNKDIHSTLAIPPGEYLEEVIGELGMTKDELAQRMGRPATKLSPIFKGEKAITPETALQLEKVVGVPAHIWTGLEAEYRLTLARQERAQEEVNLKKEIELVARYPYNELVKAGEIEKQKSPIGKVKALHAFFGVVSLFSIPELQRYKPAFRCGKSTRGERTPEAVAAWLRMGERRAQKINCSSYNKDRLYTLLPKLRSLTLQQPEVFQQQLVSALADCGVALVICPHFSKTMTHGATFWLGREKAVLMLTIRGKWADIFWFSLFHEIGHIIMHSKQGVILENDGDDKIEKEADDFASSTLIPREACTNFMRRGSFYKNDITAFADAIAIHTGIVVGRLQHEKKIPPQWANDLRVRYEWSKS